MKAKVFIVIDHLGEGGAQRQIVEFLNQADKARFDFTVVNLDAAYNTIGKEISDSGVRIIEIAHRGSLNLGTLGRLIWLFRRERPDIVYTYLFTADSYGRLAAKLAGVPVIICAMRAVDKWKRLHHIFSDWALTLFTDKVTVNAEGARDFLVKKEHFPGSKIVTIYNGIDLGRFSYLQPLEDVRRALNIPQGVLVVGMVARMSKQKDYKTFFTAAEIVVNQLPEVYFLAVGDGPLKASLESSVFSRQLKDKVIFTGQRRDAEAVINAFDIGVLSSHYEGCPNVILEYMACSKPVVASDVGGCAELVIEGKTGFIVPEAQSEALAERLIRLLNDRELRERMGREGRSRVEESFTSGIMARNTEKLFIDMLRKKKVCF